jgi:predicted DNA-binding mobile mystery protein A
MNDIMLTNKKENISAHLLYNFIYSMAVWLLDFGKMQRKPVEKIERLRLDRTFNKLRTVLWINRPAKGWIKVIRENLGMTISQLARRLGTTPSRVSAIEKGEAADSLSLNTLNKVAEGLNCKLFYVLVPEKSLQAILEEQAKKQVIRISKNVSHSMLLENQVMDKESMEDYISVQVEEMLQKRINEVWEET